MLGPRVRGDGMRVEWRFFINSHETGSCKPHDGFKDQQIHAPQKAVDAQTGMKRQSKGEPTLIRGQLQCTLLFKVGANEGTPTTGPCFPQPFDDGVHVDPAVNELAHGQVADTGPAPAHAHFPVDLLQDALAHAIRGGGRPNLHAVAAIGREIAEEDYH